MRSKVSARAVSLVEILFVVILISILAAAGISNKRKIVEQARAEEATHYLTALRVAEARYRAADSSGQYTSVLSRLDTDMPLSLKYWNLPPSISTPGATGRATLTRTAGAYAGQTLGIKFGSATVCGTFAPMLPLPPCTSD